MQETWVWSLGQEDLLEKEIAICFRILAWETPWTEEPGGPPSMGSQKPRTQLSDWACTHPLLKAFWLIKFGPPKMIYLLINLLRTDSLNQFHCSLNIPTQQCKDEWVTESLGGVCVCVSARWKLFQSLLEVSQECSPCSLPDAETLEREFCSI